MMFRLSSFSTIVILIPGDLSFACLLLSYSLYDRYFCYFSTIRHAVSPTSFTRPYPPLSYLFFYFLSNSFFKFSLNSTQAFLLDFRVSGYFVFCFS